MHAMLVVPTGVRVRSSLADKNSGEQSISHFAVGGGQCINKGKASSR
jgi:hypothetical protein